MGITVYLPRYRLPGAAPSPVAVAQAHRSAQAEAQQQPQVLAQALPDLPELPLESPPESPPLHAYAAEPQALQDSHAEAPAFLRRAPKIDIAVSAPAAREAAPIIPMPAARAVLATDETATRFQALLFPATNALAVLTLLPALARQQLQERERQLLQNILRWLGVAEPSLRGTRPFQWPLPNFPGGGLPLAGASLRAFLDQAQREEKFTRVLIFGVLLQEALEATAAPRERYATYSLQELVAVPALKRECWLTLEPLRQALAP
jgi:hypothetical protein